jgi:selenoprotein W-related protein
LAAKLLTEYKQRIKDMTLIPQGGGCFELSVGGELIYSKLKTGQFPDEGAMLQEVGKRVK